MSATQERLELVKKSIKRRALAGELTDAELDEAVAAVEAIEKQINPVFQAAGQAATKGAAKAGKKAKKAPAYPVFQAAGKTGKKAKPHAATRRQVAVPMQQAGGPAPTTGKPTAGKKAKSAGKKAKGGKKAKTSTPKPVSMTTHLNPTIPEGKKGALDAANFVTAPFTDRKGKFSGRQTLKQLKNVAGATGGVAAGYRVVRTREGAEHFNAPIGSKIDGKGNVVGTRRQKKAENLERRGEALAQNAKDNLGGTGAGKALEGAGMAAQVAGALGTVAEVKTQPRIQRRNLRRSGDERLVDPTVQRAVKYDTRNAKTPQEARDQLMIPRMVDDDFGVAKPQPSMFLRYWQSRLPDPSLQALHANSGATPPSEGVIMDASGRVIAQDVGHGEDHYLPFKGGKMKQARGGEYVRTRTAGGITTEDIIAATKSGAKAATVVSHSGIFTIEFQQGRKLETERMQSRYGKLLDSLANEVVQPNAISPEREAEIREKVRDEIPGISSFAVEQRARRIRDMKRAERDNPTPAAETKDKWRREFLMENAEKFSDSENQPYTTDRLIEDSKKYGVDIFSDTDAIERLGLQDKYKKYEEHKTREYQSSLRALRLNGQGYEKALQALQEQFPYQIKSVNWTPPDAQSARIKDLGYVKANFNRPDAVLEGYWDREIEGAYKHAASSEGYQNLGARYKSRELDSLDRDGLTGNTRIGQGKALAPQPQSSAVPPDPSVPPEGRENPNGGEIAPTPEDSLNDESRVAVTANPAGVAYSGFRQMKEQPRSLNYTPYQQDLAVVKMRKKLEKAGELDYDDSSGAGSYDPWSTGKDNPIRQKYPALFAEMSNVEFMEKMRNDKTFRGNVMDNVESLYKKGSNSNDILGAIVDYIGSGFDGVASNAIPKNPRSAASLVSYVGKPLKEAKQFDFTSGSIDGSYYLKGLEKDEYEAVWGADPDIQDYLSKQKSGKLTISSRSDVFERKMHDRFKAMDAALEKANEWQEEIAIRGDADKMPTDGIKYDGVDYTAWSAKELQLQVARDALALAKMKQLRQQSVSAGGMTTKKIEADYKQNAGLVQAGKMPTGRDYDRTPPEEQLAGNGKDVADLAAGRMSDEDYENRPVTDDLRTSGGPPPEQPVTQNPAPSGKQNPPVVSAPVIDEAKLEDSRKKLNSLTGLDPVKEEFNALIEDAKINAQRKAHGLPVRQKAMNLVFTGNPGTGKTTVANELARSYHALGLIPTDKYDTVNRSDLVGSYAGETAQKTKAVLDKAKGGVLLIDEAYSLKTGEHDEVGQEAIDQIVASSELNKDDTVLILAGYAKDMKKMMAQNGGMASRFPRTIDFPDYKPSELTAIGANAADADKYEYSDDAVDEFAFAAGRIYAEQNGNARDVRNFQDAVARAQGARISREIGIMDATTEQLREVTAGDVKNASELYFSQRS